MGCWIGEARCGSITRSGSRLISARPAAPGCDALTSCQVVLATPANCQDRYHCHVGASARQKYGWPTCLLLHTHTYLGIDGREGVELVMVQGSPELFHVGFG